MQANPTPPSPLPQPFVTADQIAAYDLRLRKLENYWIITLTIAAVLGLGGSFIGYALFDSGKQIAKMQGELESSKKALETAKAEAVQEIAAKEKVALANVNKAVREALAEHKSQAVNTWLTEERQQRIARDNLQSNWIRVIYEAATANPESDRGANGHWQGVLRAQNALVKKEIAPQ